MASRKKVLEEPVQRCETCRYFKAAKEVEFCRRYPPVPLFDIAEGGVDSHLPVTARDGWCGEWAAKLNS